MDSHDQLRRRARVDRLEFAGLNPIAQDQLHDVAEGVLVCANIVPVVLDRDQHDVVDALLGEQIFLVVGQDFEDQPLEALGGGGLGPRNRPGSFLDLRQAAMADRLDDGGLGWEEAVDIGRRHAKLGRNVGHRGLGKSQPAEQSLRGLHDPGAGIVGLGSDLRSHRSRLSRIL